MKNKFKDQSKLEHPPRLSEQVADRLIAEIDAGSFRSEEKFPSEAALAQQFGVSRTVIREALARLKYDGILDSRQGIGARVVGNGGKRSFRLDNIAQANAVDIGYLFELRAVLDGDAAYLAAERRSDKHLQQLNQCLKYMAAAVRDGGDGTDPDVNFHSVIAEASLNPYLSELMQFLNDKLVILIRKARSHSSYHADLPLVVQKEHEAIYKAIADKSPAEARKAVLRHIKNAGSHLNVNVGITT